jgi:putative hydrolase of the HAD superfamily
LTIAPALIAWDFDGVLNRNIENGDFVWHKGFERDLGVSVDSFTQYHFRSGRFAKVLCGERDLLDLTRAWIVDETHDIQAETVLEYWFRQDDLPDAEMIRLLESLPMRHVIATNNEARRAAYICDVSGWGARVEQVFAAGPMGVAKPDPAFFERITAWSGLAPVMHMLVDDNEKNVIAARKLGWQGFHFTDETRADLPAALRV